MPPRKKKREPIRLSKDQKAAEDARAAAIQPEIPDRLNFKQQRFVEEFCVNFNATQAAIKAGYSKRSAAETGYDLLRNPHISAAIADYMRRKSEAVEVAREELIKGFERIRQANILDFFTLTPDGDPYVDLVAVSREKGYAISELQVDDYKDGRGEDTRAVKRIRLKMDDRQSAGINIAKLQGQFVEKIEHRGTLEIDSIRQRMRESILACPDAASAEALAARYEQLFAELDALMAPKTPARLEGGRA